jgi:predicted small secreted protein
MRRCRLLIPALLALGATIASACNSGSVEYRGAGLHVDTLPVGDMVAVYRAVLAGSFNIADPSLTVLVDPKFLPRQSGLAGGDTMPSALLAALRRDGLVQGTCQVPVRDTRMPLICRAERAGYVVRFSEPFALGAGGGRDSAQVHLVVQQFAIPNGPMAERMRFERAYHVARRGAAWRAVREARLPQP